MKTKNIQIRIYDKDEIELAIETNYTDTPTWKWEIGKGQTDTTIQLDYPFDDIPSYIQSNNLVKINEISADNPRGVNAYTGIIGEIKPHLEGTNEGVDVEVLGLSSALNWTNYTTVSGGTTVTVTTTEIADVIKDIVDRWQTETGYSFIDYDVDSIDDTGVEISLELVDKKCNDAINEVMKFADSDWYWYINNDGKVHLHELPTTATHTFIVGKDVLSIEANETMKEILNQQTVFYDGGNVTITSSASIGSYGRHEGKYIRDDNIKDIGTATARATKEVFTGRDPMVTGNIEVSSEYVDLPDIRIGDTVKIKNYNEDGAILTDNNPIVSIDYGLDKASLEIGEIKSNFARELVNFIENIT